MESICPLCNGLNDSHIICENCGNRMDDYGRAQECADPYGGQQDINDSYNYCIHLFKCERCGRTKRVKIDKINA